MADRVACFFAVLGFVWGVDRGGISTAVTCLLEIDENLLQLKSWTTLRRPTAGIDVEVDTQSNYAKHFLVRAWHACLA